MQNKALACSDPESLIPLLHGQLLSPISGFLCPLPSGSLCPQTPPPAHMVIIKLTPIMPSLLGSEVPWAHSAVPTFTSHGPPKQPFLPVTGLPRMCCQLLVMPLSLACLHLTHPFYLCRLSYPSAETLVGLYLFPGCQRPILAWSHCTTCLACACHAALRCYISVKFQQFLRSQTSEILPLLK